MGATAATRVLRIEIDSTSSSYYSDQGARDGIDSTKLGATTATRVLEKGIYSTIGSDQGARDR